jgi:hypothetical protein
MLPDPSADNMGRAKPGQSPAFGASVHFTFEELTHTDTGLPNQPSGPQWSEMVRLVSDILEPYRALVGPIKINSGFRSPEVNAAIGGVATSQHVKGEAADTVPLCMPLWEAFQKVKASDIPFDQLILEPTWIHISVASPGSKPRRQCLRAHKEGGRMVYERA